MKDRPKKCCKCGEVVAVYKPVSGGIYNVDTVKPFTIQNGKFICKECKDKEGK